MRKLIMFLLVSIIGGMAFAQTNSSTTTLDPTTPVVAPVVATPVTVTTVTEAPNALTSLTAFLNAAGAQGGYFYGVRATHGFSYLAAKLVNVGPTNWNLSLDGGLIATSGAAVTLDYDLMKAFTLQQVPVLGFFDTLKIGVGGMATDITAWSSASQINKADNRLDYGGDILISKTIKW